MMARAQARFGGASGGFTLLEILAVVAIIMVLVGMIATAAGSARRKARRAEVLSFIKNIEAAAKTFQLSYNRWPWEVEGATLKANLGATDIFSELSPGNAALAPCSYQPLLNRQRAEYLAIPPEYIHGGRVLDAWGSEYELFWNPDARAIVIVSPGENRKNESVDSAGRLHKAGEQGDDINNL